MKDLLKTGISVVVVMLILCIAFFIVGNAKYGIELLTTTKLDIKDPTVKVLYERIKDETHLRDAKVIANELKSEQIIYLVMDNLKEDDYKVKKIEHEKIICYINDKIKFTSNEDCRVRVIENSLFKEYQKKLFNIEYELEFKDFEYHGYECKNSGDKYYCMYNQYTNTVVGYSVFDSAYKVDNKVYIRDYYLQIDYLNKERCSKYFGEEFCIYYHDKEKPSLGKEVIMNDGVLYEHVFAKNGDAYYLETSYIVTER